MSSCGGLPGRESGDQTPVAVHLLCGGWRSGTTSRSSRGSCCEDAAEPAACASALGTRFSSWRRGPVRGNGRAVRGRLGASGVRGPDGRAAGLSMMDVEHRWCLRRCSGRPGSLWPAPGRRLVRPSGSRFVPFGRRWELRSPSSWSWAGCCPAARSGVRRVPLLEGMAVGWLGPIQIPLFLFVALVAALVVVVVTPGAIGGPRSRCAWLPPPTPPWPTDVVTGRAPKRPLTPLTVAIHQAGRLTLEIDDLLVLDRLTRISSNLRRTLVACRRCEQWGVTGKDPGVHQPRSSTCIRFRP